MNAYGGVEVELTLFFTLQHDGVWWLACGPADLLSGKYVPVPFE
jgi:hypothetical protein